MHSIRNIIVTILVVFASGCATVAEKDSSERPDEAPEILQVLPERIEDFTYRGMRVYPDPWGYSLVYQYLNKHLSYADVYIFPVPQEAAGYSHIEVVKGMTSQALDEIEYATSEGTYSEFNVISSDTFEVNEKFATKVEVYLVKDNLASYSLVYLTESDGKLLKVRMTMPDNASNRSNTTWQKFVESIFAFILANIEKA